MVYRYQVIHSRKRRDAADGVFLPFSARSFLLSNYICDHISFAEDESSKDSLLSAVRLGDVENLEIYLRHGAYIESRDEKNYSILSLAASRGHIEVVRMLLDKGAAMSCR